MFRTVVQVQFHLLRIGSMFALVVLMCMEQLPTLDGFSFERVEPSSGAMTVSHFAFLHKHTDEQARVAVLEHVHELAGGMDAAYALDSYGAVQLNQTIEERYYTRDLDTFSSDDAIRCGNRYSMLPPHNAPCAAYRDVDIEAREAWRQLCLEFGRYKPLSHVDYVVLHVPGSEANSIGGYVGLNVEDGLFAIGRGCIINRIFAVMNTARNMMLGIDGVATLTHEFGHQLGFEHTFFTLPQSSDPFWGRWIGMVNYGNSHDIMGNARFTGTVRPSFGLAYRDASGWTRIHHRKLFNPASLGSGQSAVVALQPFDAPEDSGFSNINKHLEFWLGIRLQLESKDVCLSGGACSSASLKPAKHDLYISFRKHTDIVGGAVFVTMAQRQCRCPCVGTQPIIENGTTVQVPCYRRSICTCDSDGVLTNQVKEITIDLGCANGYEGDSELAPGMTFVTTGLPVQPADNFVYTFKLISPPEHSPVFVKVTKYNRSAWVAQQESTEAMANKGISDGNSVCPPNTCGNSWLGEFCIDFSWYTEEEWCALAPNGRIGRPTVDICGKTCDVCAVAAYYNKGDWELLERSEFSQSPRPKRTPAPKTKRRRPTPRPRRTPAPKRTLAPKRTPASRPKRTPWQRGQRRQSVRGRRSSAPRTKGKQAPSRTPPRSRRRPAPRPRNPERRAKRKQRARNAKQR